MNLLFPLGVILAPLIGALIAGLGRVGRKNAHRITILGVAVSFALSFYIAKAVFLESFTWNGPLYLWANTGGLSLQIGLLLDPLTALMMLVVTFISLMVHIYTVGYMVDDPSYQRFFSYISLFTFSMLVLVMSNNFLQLFFGWEAVGLVSYLLIGFWFKKESAIVANLKAFLVNRVGDAGFLIGIALVYGTFHSLQYADVFAAVNTLKNPDLTWLCIALFIGAMGKSAQVPLHVWLPDSMEGPTPISALIHAATMVTAGVFMVARLSPLFEYSDTALNFILCVGATTCFFMGLLGLVQNDIKRIIAYSTLSQLGYMVTALGASAYSLALFHLTTHAFFKALLFLGAGAVIIALHHEQDIRRMGNLRKALPITYTVMLIGSLALIGFPGFSGFYSKDLIIEAVHHSNLPGSTYAYACVLFSVLITALYTFRLFFKVFHGPSHVEHSVKAHLHEVPVVVWGPLVVLAIPSVIAGIYLVGPLLHGALDASLFILPKHPAMQAIGTHTPSWWGMPFALAITGVGLAFLSYISFPHWPAQLQQKCQGLYNILNNHYGFDTFNQEVLVPAIQRMARAFSHWGDQIFIDGWLVNGSANIMVRVGAQLRRLQSGYLYHYVFGMVVGVIGALLWLTSP
jgi:NADH-quinone oxidoreductase subunit L